MRRASLGDSVRLIVHVKDLHLSQIFHIDQTLVMFTGTKGARQRLEFGAISLNRDRATVVGESPTLVSYEGSRDKAG